MSKTANQEKAVAQAKANGMVEMYWPNGSSFDAFYERCCECRHFDPKAEENPPEQCCAWGILDRIYTHSMGEDRYGYGTHFEDPELIEVDRWKQVTCRKFSRKGDFDDGTDPPKPDMPGQMFFNDVDVPTELTISVRELSEAGR